TKVAKAFSRQLEDRPKDSRRFKDLGNESRLRRQGCGFWQNRRRKSRQGQSVIGWVACRHPDRRECLRQLPQGLSALEAVAHWLRLDLAISNLSVVDSRTLPDAPY